MAKLKKLAKLELRYKASLVLIVALLCVGGVKVVQSFTNNSDQAPKIVNEAGGIINYAEAEIKSDTEVGEYEEPILGANTLATPWQDVNGDITYHIQQTFIDASTTIVSIPDPFFTASSTGIAMQVLKDDGDTEWLGATSTVEMAKLYITGAATSSFSVKCGASANASATATVFMIESGKVGTSTLSYIENGLELAQGAEVAGSTTPKILLTPNYPYFTCVVSLADVTNSKAFTQTGNTFAGKIWIRVSRSRI